VVGGGAIAARDLVGEHEQQQIVERHLLLVGETRRSGACRGMRPSFKR